jgi:hypothetical protein
VAPDRHDDPFTFEVAANCTLQTERTFADEEFREHKW